MSSVKEPSSAPEIEGRTFEFALRVVKVCLARDKRSGVGRTLSNQPLRSAPAVGADVTDAQAARGRPAFVSEPNIAFEEAREPH
jgi:four helix bundle protein